MSRLASARATVLPWLDRVTVTIGHGTFAASLLSLQVDDVGLSIATAYGAAVSYHATQGCSCRSGGQ
jgi:hypothetical protein